MNESQLSHRGLMKMANAKMDYLIELEKVERFIRKNGETEDVNRYMEAVEDRFKHTVHKIYAEDKQLNIK